MKQSQGMLKILSITGKKIEEERRDTECQSVGGSWEKAATLNHVVSKACLRSSCRSTRLTERREGDMQLRREEHLRGNGPGKAPEVGAAWYFRGIGKSQ